MPSSVSSLLRDLAVFTSSTVALSWLDVARSVPMLLFALAVLPLGSCMMLGLFALFEAVVGFALLWVSAEARKRARVKSGFEDVGGDEDDRNDVRHLHMWRWLRLGHLGCVLLTLGYVIFSAVMAFIELSEQEGEDVNEYPVLDWCALVFAHTVSLLIYLPLLTLAWVEAKRIINDEQPLGVEMGMATDHAPSAGFSALYSNVNTMLINAVQFMWTAVVLLVVIFAAFAAEQVEQEFLYFVFLPLGALAVLGFLVQIAAGVFVSGSLDAAAFGVAYQLLMLGCAFLPVPLYARAPTYWYLAAAVLLLLSYLASMGGILGVMTEHFHRKLREGRSGPAADEALSAFDGDDGDEDVMHI